MEKSEILKHLKNYIESKTASKNQKAIDPLVSKLTSITEEAISIGNAPKYFFAYLECNSTGVGTSTFKGTETQRTVARDYIVNEHLFIDGDIETGKKGLSMFYLKPGQTINYCSKDNIEKLAKEEGFKIHLQYFRDLNFTLEDHRLNRHKVHITKEPFSFPIRPIIATVSTDGDKLTIGFVYEKDGKEHIIIEPIEEKPKPKFGCAPWMFLGFIFPPILIVAVIVLLAKYKKEQMIG